MSYVEEEPEKYARTCAHHRLAWFAWLVVLVVECVLVRRFASCECGLVPAYLFLHSDVRTARECFDGGLTRLQKSMASLADASAGRRRVTLVVYVQCASCGGMPQDAEGYHEGPERVPLQPAFFLAVEVMGKAFSFGMDACGRIGLIALKPKAQLCYVRPYKRRALGETPRSARDVREWLRGQEDSQEWSSQTFSLSGCHSVHFAEVTVRLLQPLPNAQLLLH